MIEPGGDPPLVSDRGDEALCPRCEKREGARVTIPDGRLLCLKCIAELGVDTLPRPVKEAA